MSYSLAMAANYAEWKDSAIKWQAHAKVTEGKLHLAEMSKQALLDLIEEMAAETDDAMVLAAKEAKALRDENDSLRAANALLSSKLAQAVSMLESK